MTVSSAAKDRRPFTITLVHKDPEGFWRARVTNGVTLDVDRRYGSWQCDVRVVLPPVAAALQARERPLERAGS